MMKSSTKMMLLAAAAAGAMAVSGVANASLNLLAQYTGTVGLSTAGCGSASQACNLTANVPAGSTVIAAYLYSSMYSTGPAGGTFNGNGVTYTPLGVNAGFLQASRANVTSIVAPIINGGPGGAYSFGVTETSGNQDGEALVVVYSNAALATSTIGILDGFSASSGDNSSITFASALHPGDAGFQAEMRIGDGFSYDTPFYNGQTSLIDVNGQRMTNVAGGCDDNSDGDWSTCTDGNLITVGGDNDLFTVANPGFPANNVMTDHERYNLAPFIADGSTVINIHTLNPSNDDNIFLETFQVTGVGRVHDNNPGVPEPATWAMMLMGFFGMGATLRRRRGATA